jgi:hypothetical protein
MLLELANVEGNASLAYKIGQLFKEIKNDMMSTNPSVMKSFVKAAAKV